jgi:hypothetical protein
MKSRYERLTDSFEVLSQDLEDADPTVYKIIEQVRLTPPSFTRD